MDVLLLCGVPACHVGCLCVLACHVGVCMHVHLCTCWHMCRHSFPGVGACIAYVHTPQGEMQGHVHGQRCRVRHEQAETLPGYIYEGWDTCMRAGTCVWEAGRMYNVQWP